MHARREVVGHISIFGTPYAAPLTWCSVEIAWRFSRCAGWALSIGDAGIGRRTRAAATWPWRPSIVPSVTASAVIGAASTQSSTRIHVRTRRNVNTLRPPYDRAVPPVGSVWFGPAP